MSTIDALPKLIRCAAVELALVSCDRRFDEVQAANLSHVPELRLQFGVDLSDTELFARFRRDIGPRGGLYAIATMDEHPTVPGIACCGFAALQSTLYTSKTQLAVAVWIQERFRGHGIGTGAASCLISTCFEVHEQVQEVVAVVRAEDRRALAFWRSLGFREAADGRHRSGVTLLIDRNDFAQAKTFRRRLL